MIVSCDVEFDLIWKIATKIYGIIPLLLKADLELNVGLTARGQIENILDVTLIGLYLLSIFIRFFY